MKRIIIFSATLFCVIAAKAQVEFGIFGGANASTASYSIKGHEQITKYKYGFHLGVGYKIPFDNHLFFSPAIILRTLGYKVAFNQPSFPPDLLASDNNTTFKEADVDILLQYDLSKKSHTFFFKAGPSFNFILFGKEKYNLVTGEYVNRSMKFSVINGYSRYNVSAVVQFGFQTATGFVVYANYMHELLSMDNEEQGPTIQNSLMSITVGKILRHKKL